jgi:hypothetical protein
MESVLCSFRFIDVFLRETEQLPIEPVPPEYQPAMLSNFNRAELDG